MVIYNIKLGFARKKVAALLQKRAFSEESKEVKSIVVLLDHAKTEIIDAFVKLRDFLKVNEQDFQLVLVTKISAGKEDFKGLVITASEITWNGNFRSEEVRDFVHHKYDLLIAFPENENELLNLMAAASTASLKVARSKAENDIFDISIAAKFEEPEIFISELKKYLKILNKIRE
ncbi:DUF6913 domain-containing protein [Salinimicrobium sp. GXAS 041]|uniref:DUF6913 domain-containing protein n=1 Tax=Salinimicrobium sp. GXAS 041 TaxID=3400806 RepID=UPI003C715840